MTYNHNSSVYFLKIISTEFLRHDGVVFVSDNEMGDPRSDLRFAIKPVPQFQPKLSDRVVL